MDQQIGVKGHTVKYSIKPNEDSENQRARGRGALASALGDFFTLDFGNKTCR
jgi:hypothetical protein